MNYKIVKFQHRGFRHLNILLLVTFFSGCTTLNGSIEKISPNALENYALVTGKLNIYNQKSERSMQDHFGPKFITYATRSKPKKVYELLIPSKDDGYFAWLMQPGNYFFHHTQTREGSEEIRLTDFDPVELHAGEIVYLGDIYIEIGERSAISSKDQLQQLANRPIGAVVQGLKVPTNVTQNVNDGSADMKEYLSQLGLLKGRVFRTELAREWQS